MEKLSEAGAGCIIRPMLSGSGPRLDTAKSSCAQTVRHVCRRQVFGRRALLVDNASGSFPRRDHRECGRAHRLGRAVASR